MPEYAYWCPHCSKASTKWSTMSAREAAIECRHCQEEAVRDPAAAHKHRLANPETESSAEGFAASRKDERISWREVICLDKECGFEDVSDFTDSTLEGPFACEQCGGATEKKWLGSSSGESERYPYFDKGLGGIVKSAQHRRDICKARGLTPVDGDYDADEHFRKEASVLRKEEADYAEYEHRLSNDPAFAQFRRAQAEGRF